MGSFAYDKEFLPVLKPDDYFVFTPQEPKPYVPGLFKVLEVEPIENFYMDWLQVPGAFAGNPPYVLAANGAAGDRTNGMGPDIVQQILQTDKNIMAQWRIEPVDDILVQLGAPGINSPLWSTPVATTYIQKRLAPHHSTVQITTAPGTDTLIWANTKNPDISGSLRGQSVTRKSRIMGISLDFSAATTIYLGDAAVAGGTAASVANHTLGFVFGGAGSTQLGLIDLPDEYYFEKGIVAQQTAAVTTTITVSLEEDNENVFDGTLKFEERSRGNHNHEFYTFGNYVPSAKIVNPLLIGQSTARCMLSGFMYDLDGATADEVPSGKYINKIPLARIPRQGAPIR